MDGRMSLDPIAAKLASEGVAFAPEIAGAARRHAIDPSLLAAVAAQETGGPGTNAGHNIVGDGGHGRGLFQIDDRWHPFASTPAAMDPKQNADYAAGMLSGLLARYGGDERKALSAYNSGSPTAAGTRTRWSDGADLSYADSVLRHYTQLTGASPHASAVEESSTAVASTGILRAQAQRLPLPAPTLPAPAHAPQLYHRRATDYLSLINDATDENLS